MELYADVLQLSRRIALNLEVLGHHLQRAYTVKFFRLEKPYNF
jgi:hypothetical protein